MIYKDKNTLNSWNKQIDKLEQEESDRTIRRRRERELNSFSRYICLIVDKEWWDCVSKEQKNQLYNTWKTIRYNNLHKKSDIKFEDWAKEIRKTTEIDKALYREKTINKLLS